MRWSLVSIIGLFAVAAASEERVRYDGHKVFNVVPKTDVHVQFLNELEEITEFRADFYIPASVPGRRVHVRLAPKDYVKWVPYMETLGMEVTVLVHNVQ
uniref:Carboxypeptidase activation peptide domain-containing protein n=1 Tax=Plectus sambesii TaxID=2011161 RepID=A0A914WY11_9BILA